MGCIRINNMVVYGHNGVYPEERKLGQKLEIDVDLAYPIETKVRHDDLDETISYSDVYKSVQHFVDDHSYKLIESLANNLLHYLLDNYKTAEAIKLRIRKYGVPMAGAYDNVEIQVSGRQGA